MKKAEFSALALLVGTMLSACSGGGGGSSPQTAPLTLRVTDAPIDQAVDVCIQFTRITVHYAGQDDVTLDYNPLPSQVDSKTHCMTGTFWNGQSPVPPVRLSALGGPLTVALAESLQVPVGRVTWIRLHFATGSYVEEMNGGVKLLACPSCEPTDNNSSRGFKLNRTFEVESGGLALTVDIDLLNSLHVDSTGYVLRPTARIENTAALGTIAGIVDIPPDAKYGEMLETGCAVYVYNAGDPIDDYHLDSKVVSSARVRYSESLRHYGYAAGALLGGKSYTVALTCDADDPDLNNDPDNPPQVTFTPGKNANVVVGETVMVNFGP